MPNYEKDLARFLDAWERVQQEIQAEDRVETLATQIGRPADELRRDLDNVARTLRRIGSVLTRRDLVEHAIQTHEVKQAKRRNESDSD